MSHDSSQSRPSRAPFITLIALILIGSIGVIITTANDLGIGTAETTGGLAADESAYYEYVAPRLDRLVEEVDGVVIMVRDKSRDILELTISGNRIEALTDQIMEFGETNGVPERFEAIHQRIAWATDTTTYTFDQARESLRAFNFSNMPNLVTDFESAAVELHAAQEQLQSVAGGTAGAIAPAVGTPGTKRAGDPHA